MASAITSIRGGVRRPEDVACTPPIGDSKSPIRGRGGRSGVVLPFDRSEFDLNREGLLTSPPFAWLSLDSDLSGVLGRGRSALPTLR
jgi:hypothetical protein